MSLDVDRAIDWAAQRRHAVLITLRRDGRAQSSDVSFAVIDGACCVSLTADRAKTANIRRDPRVVFHITEPSSWSYVSFDGTATLGPVTTDPGDGPADDLVAVYRAITGEDHPDWDEFRQAMVDQRRLVLRLTPTGAVGQINGD